MNEGEIAQQIARREEGGQRSRRFARPVHLDEGARIEIGELPAIAEREGGEGFRRMGLQHDALDRRAECPREYVSPRLHHQLGWITADRALGRYNHKAVPNCHPGRSEAESRDPSLRRTGRANVVTHQY